MRRLLWFIRLVIALAIFAALGTVWEWPSMAIRFPRFRRADDYYPYGR